MEGIVQNDRLEEDVSSTPLSPSQEFSAITARWNAAQSIGATVSNDQAEYHLLYPETDLEMFNFQSGLESFVPLSLETESQLPLRIALVDEPRPTNLQGHDRHHFHPSRLQKLDSLPDEDDYVEVRPGRRRLTAANAEPLATSSLDERRARNRDNDQPETSSDPPANDASSSRLALAISRVEGAKRKILSRSQRRNLRAESSQTEKGEKYRPDYDSTTSSILRLNPTLVSRERRKKTKNLLNLSSDKAGHGIRKSAALDHRSRKAARHEKIPHHHQAPSGYLDKPTWIIEEIRTAKTLIASKGGTMPQYTLQYHHRRLKGLELTLEEMTMADRAHAKKSHQARFFERQCTAKLLEQLQTYEYQCAESRDIDASSTAKQQMYTAEVDYNYALYSPFNKNYTRLFNPPSRNRTAYRPGVGLTVPSGLQKADEAPPPVWRVVEHCMSDDTPESLDDLRLGRLNLDKLLDSIASISGLDAEMMKLTMRRADEGVEEQENVVDAEMEDDSDVEEGGVKLGV